MIILHAPSTGAADSAATQLGGGTVFGVAATLALRSGRYLVVSCALADKPAILQGVYAASGWRVIAHGARLSPGDLLESDIALIAYVSGYLDGQGG